MTRHLIKYTIIQNLIHNTFNQEYLPIDGLASFNEASKKLLFGAENPAVKEGRIVTIQTLSGTGSLRVGFEFLSTYTPGDVYVSKPTWGNLLKFTNL